MNTAIRNPTFHYMKTDLKQKQISVTVRYWERITD